MRLYAIMRLLLTLIRSFTARYLKNEEVVLMDNYYAKRTVALPSRESK